MVDSTTHTAAEVRAFVLMTPWSPIVHIPVLGVTFVINAKPAWDDHPPTFPTSYTPSGWSTSQSSSNKKGELVPVDTKSGVLWHHHRSPQKLLQQRLYKMLMPSTVAQTASSGETTSTACLQQCKSLSSTTTRATSSAGRFDFLLRDPQYVVMRKRSFVPRGPQQKIYTSTISHQNIVQNAAAIRNVATAASSSTAASSASSAVPSTSSSSSSTSVPVPVTVSTRSMITSSTWWSSSFTYWNTNTACPYLYGKRMMLRSCDPCYNNLYKSKCQLPTCGAKKRYYSRGKSTRTSTTRVSGGQLCTKNAKGEFFGPVRPPLEVVSATTAGDLLFGATRLSTLRLAYTLSFDYDLHRPLSHSDVLVRAMLLQNLARLLHQWLRSQKRSNTLMLMDAEEGLASKDFCFVQKDEDEEEFCVLDAPDDGETTEAEADDFCVVEEYEEMPPVLGSEDDVWCDNDLLLQDEKGEEDEKDEEAGDDWCFLDRHNGWAVV
ncbi:unnamed protein product [Amoebophrya sp. A25]|nr:unnamed protein product [Amoebophrya sp. A25]|eukprot:GSA25T00021764001.1